MIAFGDDAIRNIRRREAVEAIFRATVLENPFILPMRPTKRQAAFLCCTAREALYGGAAGGGKSDGLLQAALQYAMVPGYRAMIFRRTLADLRLPGALIDRSHQYLDGKAKWNGQRYEWTFPAGGTLTFGYMEQDQDASRYKGSQLHFIGWDELTELGEYPYRYMFSRLRRDQGCPIPLRVRGATNPGGRGHHWVKRDFVKPGDKARPFFPAKVQDNPHLDAGDYIQSMARLDPISRAQLLQGSWDEYSGGRFKAEWFRGWHRGVDKAGRPRLILEHGDPHGVLVQDCWTFMMVDPAASVKTSADYTVIGVFMVTPYKDLVILDMIRGRFGVDRIVPEIASACALYGPQYVGIEDAGFQAAIISEARKCPGIPAVRSMYPQGRDKLVRATPAINRCREGQIYVPDETMKCEWLEDFMAEVVSFTGDEDQDAFDDQVDVLGYGVLSMDEQGLLAPIVVTPPTEDEMGWYRGDDDWEDFNRVRGC